MDKVLVANRGEIAVRAFRAAYELGIRTVAVYTHADRGSLHRQKADEAYEIGDPEHPVRAYLDPQAIVEAAVRVGADAVYPGYGFLSESPLLAAACKAAGVTFVGPPAEVLELTGDKIRARVAADEAGLAVLAASASLTGPEAAAEAARAIGFPVFVKAASGGGGRGLRLVREPGELAAAIQTAMREAKGAFGDETVFLEQAMVRPRHIEVQLLAGADGEVIHLYERDCSVQRRHQKVLELAPAPNLDPALRESICADAVRFGRAVGYRNAGTVEFLVAPDGSGGPAAVFIEMNPRVQVEHTVTEEVTDVDIVKSQLRIAAGATLADLGLAQDRITVRGQALQCRITTEDPTNGFRPDLGRISAYRSPGGAGIRLDGGAGYTGGEVSPYFDSLLVKLTARGPDLATAASRARRALAEFRVRGVLTNVAFLGAVLSDPDFLAGEVTTAFIDERPQLTSAKAGADRATRLLELVADVTVNRPHGKPPTLVEPAAKLPAMSDDERHAPAPPGSRQRLDELGPAGFARWLRDSSAIGVTDTTLRDAHQSLLATRMRTYDMVAVAGHMARRMPQLLSAEVWGGATYDVALRFLSEDPWERLARLREALPNVCLQMLLRGRNAVGYSSYPDAVVRAFVDEARATGIDIFRVFDANNDVQRMRPGIEAVAAAGGVAEGTLCYTGDLSDPGQRGLRPSAGSGSTRSDPGQRGLRPSAGSGSTRSSPGQRSYTLDHYLDVAEGVIAAGAHVLCIKDMAGLLRAPAARTLVTALRERFDAPVHLHTHDTAGGQLATYLAAVEAGVDAIDGAAPPLSGMTSQPSLAAIVAATDHTDRVTGLSLDVLGDLEPYWESVRDLYAPFEAGLRSPTGTVYRHEIPGGQLSNLRQQAVALGLGDRFEEVEALYERCNRLLGDLIKVTPTSKVVGDLALYLASAGIDPDALEDHPGDFDLPESVLGFLQGELGTPPGGWPEPFRTKALAGRNAAADEIEIDDGGVALTGPDRRATLNRLMFPEPAREQIEAADRWGDVAVVPTRAFFYGLEPAEEIVIQLEPGVRLFVELEAIGEPDERGTRTVLIKLNGQTRPVDVRDRSINVEHSRAEKANLSDPLHVAASLSGVVTLRVGEGDSVQRGQAVGSIEAMKMESAISAPVDGRVARVVVESGTTVEPGDLLLVLTAA